MSAVRENRRGENPNQDRIVTRSTINKSELSFENTNLGKGQFGEVSRGTCRGVAVAIKRIKNVDHKKLEVFQREVELARTSSHPNIVQYMGVCYDTEYNYIVTELVECGNLGRLLTSPDTSLSIVARLKMALDTAKGLAWLHGSSPPLIHRDLKPENLLVTKRSRIKICDFGLAQLKENQYIKDPPNRLIGSPYWMAPEILAHHSFNQNSDIYSFGLVLWCLVTREACPYTHYTELAPFKKAITEKHERPIIPDATLPALKGLIESCWHPDPTKRPVALNIVTALKQIIIDHQIDDLDGREFWKKYFLEHENVTWNDFVVGYLHYAHSIDSDVGLSDYATIAQIRLAPTIQLLEFAKRNTERNGESVTRELERRKEQDLQEIEDPAISALKSVLVTIDNSDGTQEDKREIVTMSKFGDILRWYGPAFRDRKHSLLTQIFNIATASWFDSGLEKQIHSKLRATNQAGTYIVRYSRHPGCFSIAVLSSKGSIGQYRIERNEMKQFVYNNFVTDSLEQMLEILSPKIPLLYVCSKGPGGRYLNGDYIESE